MKPDSPFTPGAEIAGEIISAPEGSGFAPGDRVASLCLLGGFAEEAVAPLDTTFKLPDTISYEQGASIIFNYGTAYFALVERGQLQEGESVLVQGAAGGVGTAAIQVAKAFGAGRVIAVTVNPEKGAVALEAGADEFVLADGFKDAVKAQGGVDIVVDPVGGDRFTDSLRCLKDDGRLLVIGFTAGEIPTVKVNRCCSTTSRSSASAGVPMCSPSRPHRQGMGGTRATPRERRAPARCRSDLPARGSGAGAAHPR